MTLTKIRKRDGRLAEFNEEKIARAIEKAFNATYKPGRGEEARKLADEVLSILEVEGQAQPDVEHIQDLVERVLMDNGYVQTAKSYILYREERSRAREMNTRLMKTYEDITFSKAKDSDIKRENANIDGDTAMGSMLKFGSEGAKQFYDMFVLNPDHARAHREGTSTSTIWTSSPSPPPAARSTSKSCSRGASPPATAPCGSPTTSPPTPPCAASPSSPTKTTSTAARAWSTSTTAWPTACARPSRGCTARTWPGPSCCWRAGRTRRGS